MSAPMTAVEFFEHLVVQFPLERGDEDFEAFVAARLQGYVDLVREMPPGDNITRAIKDDLGKIENLCGCLKVAIHEYLRGLPSQAYSRLDEGISRIRDELSILSTGYVERPFIRELYRIRQEQEPGASFSKGELFHIPFQLRHKVTRQRYWTSPRMVDTQLRV